MGAKVYLFCQYLENLGPSPPPTPGGILTDPGNQPIMTDDQNQIILPD